MLDTAANDHLFLVTETANGLPAGGPGGRPLIDAEDWDFINNQNLVLWIE
jgi:hypothetical protein